MSEPISNESSISSHRSSVSHDSQEIPSLVVAECLPTFAEAATAQLPHVVVPDEEPPSFHLSNVLQEAEQEHPPLSPRTAEVLLRTHPNINEAINAIAYRLIATIHRHTL